MTVSVAAVIRAGLRTQVHQYLDSAEMHDWLEHFDNGFWGIKANTQRTGFQLHWC